VQDQAGVGYRALVIGQGSQHEVGLHTRITWLEAVRCLEGRRCPAMLSLAQAREAEVEMVNGSVRSELHRLAEVLSLTGGVGCRQRSTEMRFGE
jgi:hypothetical protein